MLQPGDSLDTVTYYIGANVEVGPDVAIASGAVLEAAPGSRLVLERGVCIGSQVVVHAYGGNLILEAEVNLGKGVLLLGAGTVGAKTCIGAESTLINPKVEAEQVIPARSLFGDPHRSQELDDSPKAEANSQNGKVPHNATVEAEAEKSAESEVQSDSTTSNGAVYGRAQVAQLVQTLFPYRNATMSDSNSS